MPTPLPPIRLTGAVALRDGNLSARTVALAGGRIASGPFPEVDLGGYLILPGIVDLHHTGALRQIGPESAVDCGMAQVDQEAAAHGVTTRCISVPWSWERPAAAPAAARDTIRRWDANRSRALTDLHLQLCADPNMVDSADDLIALVRDHGVSQVLFRDLASAVRDLRTQDPEGFIRWCRAQGGAPETLSAALDTMLAAEGRMPRHLCRLAEQFDEIGVLYGSVGDRSAEGREHLSMIGARLSVDPETAQVAGAARAVGDPVLLSAAGLLRPAVCGRKLDTIDLLRRGTCDALISGAHSASPLQAAFRLVDLGLMPLAQAWRHVSEIPARILRMPDRGEIALGRRADLTIVHAHTRAVEATISGGRLAFLSGEAAHRFIGLRDDLHSLAAE
ncbi:MAG: alkylphosphonate utilization protein [Pseudomonadota bacterium]